MSTRPPDGWMLIEEDAPVNVPLDEPVLLAWRDEWTGKWQMEVNVAVSEYGGWRHGRATHWLPLPDPPSLRSRPCGRDPAEPRDDSDIHDGSEQ